MKTSPKPHGRIHGILIAPFLRLMDLMSGRQVPKAPVKRKARAS